MSSFPKIAKCLRIFDIFEKSYCFESENSHTFKTTLGGIFSVLLYFSIGVLSFLFGQEIYLRRNPVSNSYDAISSPNNTIIKITDIPIIVTFHQYDASPLQNLKSILELETALFVFDPEYNISIETYYGFTECDSNKFSLFQNYVNETVKHLESLGHSPKCLITKDSLYFKNDYAQSDSAFINYQFRICSNKTSSFGCLPQDELNQITEQIYILNLLLSILM